MTEGMKVCTKCGPPAKPITEFNKNAARPDGHETRCRICTAQAQRDRKAQMEKAKPRNGRKKKPPRDPGPVRSSASRSIPSEAVTLDAQLLRAVKKSAIMEFVKNDLPRMVEESFS